MGSSWRPPYAMMVRAEVVPPGKFAFTPNSIAFPSGEFFARYSPDLAHWSSWQALEGEGRVDPANRRQAYHGLLRVSQLERQPYVDLLVRYMRMDVPWGSDEEAAVKWILTQDPDFFDKQIPFIGYVQFRFELGLKGDQAIEQLKFEMEYNTSGKQSAPKNLAAIKAREVPWRFRAK